MKSILTATIALALAAAFTLGCKDADETASAPNDNAPITGAAYLLNAEPEGTQTVAQVREASLDGDTVAVLGRIGGDANPWTKGRAAFKIVDPELQACSDIPGDQCATPWDYCCELAGLQTGTALVKIVDEDGNLVKTDARTLLGVEELDTVVAEGTAERDEAGNLTVLAKRIYVKK